LPFSPREEGREKATLKKCRKFLPSSELEQTPRVKGGVVFFPQKRKERGPKKERFLSQQRGASRVCSRRVIFLFAKEKEKGRSQTRGPEEKKIVWDLLDCPRGGKKKKKKKKDGAEPSREGKEGGTEERLILP